MTRVIHQITCYLVFFSLFSLRFSFGVRWAFFCCSLLPLSLLPLSPMSVFSVLENDDVGL